VPACTPDLTAPSGRVRDGRGSRWGRLQGLPGVPAARGSRVHDERAWGARSAAGTGWRPRL